MLQFPPIGATSDVGAVTGGYARDSSYNIWYLRPILYLLAVALSKAYPFDQCRHTRQTKGWLNLTGLASTQLEVTDN
jgi:hypothetical protein